MNIAMFSAWMSSLILPEKKIAASFLLVMLSQLAKHLLDKAQFSILMLYLFQVNGRGWTSLSEKGGQ